MATAQPKMKPGVLSNATLVLGQVQIHMSLFVFTCETKEREIASTGKSLTTVNALIRLLHC